MFEGYDFSDFWEKIPDVPPKGAPNRKELMSHYKYLKENVGAPVTQEMIDEAEKKLGYKLPESYLWLMRQQNGGILAKVNFAAPNHVISLHNIYGLDSHRANSLIGEMGTNFWINEWGYPDVGIAICGTISGGHDMIFLNYKSCGRNGEPSIVLIDTEFENSVTFLSHTFENFISSLY